ncbi:MAG: chitobiase/beta-hexosaminidase C-terminal domain-containing protein, partial [Candidatus Cloacimonadaceae bacterium]
MYKKLLILCAICLVLFACDKSTEPEYQIATPYFNPEGGMYFSPQSVEIKCSVAGVTFRYTLDGTNPTTTSDQYTEPLQVSAATTIKTIAYKNKMKPSEIAEASYTFEVAALFINPLTGTFTEPKTVTITALTAGTVIKYTTDGSEPNENSTTYTEPFIADGNMTLKAKGFIEGWSPSETKTVNYTFNVTRPTLSVGSGTYNNTFNLTMTTPTAGASIRYTTDGSEPNEGSFLYEEPVTINTSIPTLKAKAFKTNWNASESVSSSYTLKVATPAMNPPSGTYTDTQNITISTVTPDTEIFYTLDNSEPTENSILYTTPIPLVSNSTLKAKAFRTGWANSNTTTGIYYFSVAAPEFNPPGGAYSGQQNVTITCATDGAEIRFTTNNTDPTATSTLFTEPIPVPASMNIRARAFKTGMTTSPIAYAIYQIVNTVATPEISLPSGVYYEPQEVTITCATPTAEIRYTTDGSEPTVSSNLFYYPIQVTAFMELKAKAFKLGWIDSETATAIYQFDTYEQIMAWGNNTYNQTNVPLGNDFIQIDAGMYHTIALRGDGSLAAWGRNNNQQCNFPPGNDYVAVSAGDNHSLALRANGTIAAWGLNDGGQCDVPDSLNLEYVSISAGGAHSLALTDNNKLIAWGNDDSGQSTTPPDSNFVKISAGANHNLALRDNGSIYSWGSNDNGQVNLFPGTNYMDIAAGDQHSVALRTDGTLIAMGLNSAGQTTVPSGNNY